VEVGDRGRRGRERNKERNSLENRGVGGSKGRELEQKT